MKFLIAVLSSSILVACGGGGSNAPASSTTGPSTAGPSTAGPSTTGPSTAGPSTTGPSPASPALAKYEGVWREDCVDHRRFTKTFTATGSTTFSVATKEEYFDNADCTGALVGTGSYGVPDENVTYAATLASASVTLLSGVDIASADVDPANSVYATGATFSITGSGVKSTEIVGTTVFARIEYATGTPPYTVVTRPALNGQTTPGALLLRNDELLALVPISGFTNSFRVNHRYIR